MDRREFVQKRRRRYLAQLLEDFEQNVLPHLADTETAREATENFKANARRKMNALAVDANDIYSLDGEVNGAAIDVKDRLFPDGRQPRVRS